MKESALSLLLQTEIEYHDTVIGAIKNAEKYVDDCRKEQAEHIEMLKQKLITFEKAESERFEQTLLAESELMEDMAVKQKEKMKSRQQEKAEHISSLLKEEVLSAIWR